jgi:hypothetical protein
VHNSCFWYVIFWPHSATMRRPNMGPFKWTFLFLLWICTCKTFDQQILFYFCMVVKWSCSLSVIWLFYFLELCSYWCILIYYLLWAFAADCGYYSVKTVSLSVALKVPSRESVSSYSLINFHLPKKFPAVVCCIFHVLQILVFVLSIVVGNKTIWSKLT